MQLCHYVTSQNGRLAGAGGGRIAIVNFWLTKRWPTFRPGAKKVRFTSMLATALSLQGDDASARTAQWRQLVDLLVQADGNIAPDTRQSVVDRIEALRPLIPIDQRRRAAIQLAPLAFDLPGVEIFALDEPGVAAPVLSRVKLDAQSWAVLIPRLPPASRALLRNRRDLPDSAVRALASYGLSDFSLPPAETTFDADSVQIRDLVARIEAFRQTGFAHPLSEADDPHVDDFTFETSAAGLIDWVSGAPREALIGISVGELAGDGGYGVDGQAAGAFRRRAPFRDARLRVAGDGGTSGDWLIAAIPVFNPRDGRFAGYHGSARRPRPDEVARPESGFAEPAMSDSLRQLTHELRTPLNGIIGFAEMIDLQLLGPSAFAYRDKARAIRHDGQRLVELIDDLDQVAQAPRGANAERFTGEVDVAEILERVTVALTGMTVIRDVTLDVSFAPEMPVAAVRPQAVERMMMRLCAAVLSLSRAGETIAVRLSGEPGSGIRFSVSRPRVLTGVDDQRLFDPGFDPDVPFPDAPLLGLGFALRLVGSLARDAGGRLSIAPDAFTLMLPSAEVMSDLPAGTA